MSETLIPHNEKFFPPKFKIWLPLRKIQCPLCFEPVLFGAKACPHCGNFIHYGRRKWREYVIPILTHFVPAAIVTLISFSCGQSLERSRIVEEQRQKNERVVLALRTELSENWAILDNSRTSLRENVKLLRQGSINAEPLWALKFDSWRYAVYGGSGLLSDFETADFQKIRVCYFVLGILDDKIRAREQYRLIHDDSGESGFVNTMVILDAAILDDLDSALEVVEQAQSLLDEKYPWVVKGRSFSLNGQGLIRDMPGG